VVRRGSQQTGGHGKSQRWGGKKGATNEKKETSIVYTENSFGVPGAIFHTASASSLTHSRRTKKKKKDRGKEKGNLGRGERKKGKESTTRASKRNPEV